MSGLIKDRAKGEDEIVKCAGLAETPLVTCFARFEHDQRCAEQPFCRHICGDTMILDQCCDFDVARRRYIAKSVELAKISKVANIRAVLAMS